MIVLPRLYAIVDSSFFPSGTAMAEAARELASVGAFPESNGA